MRIALSALFLFATHFLATGSPVRVEEGNADSSDIRLQATRIARSNQDIELSSHPQMGTENPADPANQNQCVYHIKTAPGPGYYSNSQNFLAVDFSIEFQQGPYAMEGIGEGNKACEYIFNTYNAMQEHDLPDGFDASQRLSTCYVRSTGYSTLLVTAVGWELPDLRIWKVEKALQAVLKENVMCKKESPEEGTKAGTVGGDGDLARGTGTSFDGIGVDRGGEGHESTDEDGCLKMIKDFMGSTKDLCKLIDPSACGQLLVGLSCL